MRLPQSRPTTRQLIAAASVCVVLLGFAFCMVHHVQVGLQIAFADEQTAIFERMRRLTAESEIADAGYLGYALSYYPSGTKQAEGSALDRVVERARQSAAREIIAILRLRTAKDFGDEPRRWIEGLRADTKTGTQSAPPPRSSDR
jgi:hypothetical protein